MQPQGNHFSDAEAEAITGLAGFDARPASVDPQSGVPLPRPGGQAIKNILENTALASIVTKNSAVDVGEFIRFVISGVAATAGNLCAVWLARRYFSFEVSLLVGIATALAISFMLSKWFAFGSRSWRRAGGEAPRFLIVYAVGCAVYWAVAVLVGQFALAPVLPTNAAEVCGILVGAATMTVTSYLGHRFFTYRTHEGTANGGDQSWSSRNV